MLYLDDIKVEFESQGFKGTHIGISHDKDKSVLFLESVRSTQSIRCLIAEAVYIFMKTDKSNSKIFHYRKITAFLPFGKNAVVFYLGCFFTAPLKFK